MTERLKKYYINNNTGSDQVITLKKEGECGVYLDLTTTQVALDNAETEVSFPSDGIYDVYLDGTLVGTAKFYADLFTSMISFLSAALCNSKISTCTSCTDLDLELLNNSYSKMMLYIANKASVYDTALITATTKIRCSAKSEWEDINYNETLKGESNTNLLLKIELAHLFMEMYGVDKGVTPSSYYNDLDVIYNYKKIIRCITSLGIRDCNPVITGGALHDAIFSLTPSNISLGESNTITITYKFTANDDTFVAVVDTNVTGVDINKFDGFTHTVSMTGETLAKDYFITYTYIRGANTYTKTVNMKTTANTPQWYGAETTTADYAGAGGEVLVSTLKGNILNVSPKYQPTSNSTSSNTGTSGKYIWWITAKPIKFLVGGFEIPTGPWDANCDPNSYAIISKQMVTVMEDGITKVTMNYYRTCPIQELAGQTLAYILNEVV